MADTVASPILQILSDRLFTLVGLPDNKILRKLRLTLAEIQTLVEEAEKRSEENEALKFWMTAVKDVAYAADDLFDEYDFWMIKRKERSIFSFWLPENPLFFGFTLGRKLKRIEAKLDALLKRRVELGRAFAAYPFKGSEETSNHAVDRETSSFVFESEIVGRTLDKEMILSMVFEPSSENLPFSVIPIVGMGGLGKTTLAKLVYNDKRVTKNFDLKFWVYATENFEVGGIAKAIMDHITQDCHEHLNVEVLEAAMRKQLQGKKFLIVLDNVWNEDLEKWSPLVRWFGVGAPGSKVIITSRSEKAVEIVGRVPPYFLKPLADDESWLLFKRIAFSSIREEENPKLEDIGKRIVMKCKGLPLAIRTLGGLLRSKREESEWLFIMEEDMWNLPEFEFHILPVLRLSYNHLPPHLKQCFAYCSIFPKDCKINKEKLILLWIAEGFVRSAKRSKRLEDVGNDHFMELLQRSFFIDVSRDEFGDIVECRMHDLVHDLALSVASVGCSIVETEAPQDVSKELRHSSLVGKSEASTILESLHEATNLRTLLLLSCKFDSIPNFFLKFGCLRALDLSRTGIRKLSGTIGSLKHLRYLDLSQNYIQRLPESISNLKNLQTLELFECHDLLELPRAICGLMNLRTLDIQACSSLSYMPSGIGNLKLLQKLPVFILGENDDCASLSELRELDLKGRLEIKQLEYVRDIADADDAKLHEKLGIHSLGLSWGHDADLGAEMSANVLESLRPSPNLRVLEIGGYKGSAFPSWIGYQDLPNLVKLSLTNCSCRELPPLGELPHLKELYLKGMSEVQHIGEEFYGKGNGNGSCFPLLKQLELYDMPNLLQWTDFKLEKASGSTKICETSSDSYEDAFPCLDTLTVMGCSKLTRFPSFPCLQNLALWNSNEQLLCSLSHLTHLSSLLIYEFHRPSALPLYFGFNFIRTLTIYDCDNLISLLDEGMQKFTLLEHLSILYCDVLGSLPPGLRYLTSLRKLDIIECRNLAYIADTITYLSSLEELTIEGCPLLESLPLGMDCLTGLRKLVIKRCPKLQTYLDMECGEESVKTDRVLCVERDSGRFLAEVDTPSESEC